MPIAGPLYSDDEIELLRRLAAEGFTALTTSFCLGRSEKSILGKAASIGVRFGVVGKNGYRLHTTISSETFRAFAEVADELGCEKHRLARIIFTIIAERKLWGAILGLGGPHEGPREILSRAPTDASANNPEDPGSGLPAVGERRSAATNESG